jgi:predicted 3-demethylubiquinone-9 3-methyltransferase (glyoxalase superfamily)
MPFSAFLSGGGDSNPRDRLHGTKSCTAAVEPRFYCSVFPDSSIPNVNTLHDTPSGDTEVVSFVLCGQPFMAISAGPLFKFNESISFIVYCENQAEIDYYRDKLSAVPEAEQYGWLIRRTQGPIL